MLIERQLEYDFITTLKSMPELSASQVVGSREVAADGETKTEDDAHATIVAVACGFRQNDAFSLSPITMSMSIAVMTRTELDPTSEGHSKVIEAIADLLSHWHKDGNAMTEALSNRKFFAGELRMDGGTARTYDPQTQTWSETINFSIRGSEKSDSGLYTYIYFADGTTNKVLWEGEVTFQMGEDAGLSDTSPSARIVFGTAVSSIADEGFAGLPVTEASFKSGLLSIGRRAFAFNGMLTKVELPDTVQSIAEEAFLEDSNIEITFQGRTKAEVQAMENYSWGLQSGRVIHCTDGDIVVGSETKVTYQNGDVVEYDINGELTRGQISSLTSIASLDIGRGVTSIATNAFYSCINLSSVTIPDSVTSIGGAAFKNCYKLTSISLPNSVTNLSGSTFYDCTGLKSASFGNGLSAVPGAIFSGCSNLSSVTLPISATVIGEGAFGGCASLRSIDIPDSVSSLNTSAFRNCYNLVDVHMPSSLKIIQEYAFENCRSLSSVTIPESVGFIGADAFHGCTTVANVYCYPYWNNLNWDEADKDDFKQDGSTICHVRLGYLDGYVSKFRNSVNVTFVGDLTGFNN